MRIALVSEHASPLAALGGVDAGGQNVHVAELARALGARGHRVRVYTRRDARALPASVAVLPNVEVIHVDAGPPEALPKDALLPYMDRFGDELARAWRADPPDVAHAHFWMSGLATRRAARALDLPWALTYHALGAEKRRHQGAEDPSPRTRVALERELLCAAGAIVATSSAEVFAHRRTGGARDLKLVPCGVALEQFDVPPAARARERPRIVTLSRLVERKGIADVIRALAHLADAELVVAGGGDGCAFAADPELARLCEVARSAGVADRVRFAGPVGRAQVAAFLGAADVVVCVPRYEPFGIVPLEAMACARPVVVSRVGGLVDTVVDGVTGLHVPASAPLALAEALARLLADRPLRATMGAAGRRRVERRYTWATVAEQTESVYRALVARSTAARETTA